MILYRYLATHGYETLRDAEFMVSSPGRFNDCLDCTARINAPPPEEIIDEYYNKEKDWFDSAVKQGLRGQQLLDFLNHPDKAPSQERYLEVLQEAFRSHKPLDKVFRILCLSDADGHKETERRMWRRYATRKGIRIGLNVDVESTKKQFVFRKVKYEDSVPVIDLSNQQQISVAFDYLDIVSTKTRIWENEREWRLCLRAKDCRRHDGLEFLKWEREMLHSVDIGCRMDVRARRGLIKMIRSLYPPKVKIRIMESTRAMYNIVYSEV